MLLDERQRVVRQIVDDEPLAADELAVVFQDRIEIVSPVAGAESVVLVEAPGVGMVRVLRAVVPFAESAGGVSGGFERLADRGFVQIEPLAAGRRAVDSAPDRDTAR